MNPALPFALFLAASIAAAQAPDKSPSPRARAKAEKLYLAGAKELDRGDVNKAGDDFRRALDLDPGNERYRVSSQIALQHQVTDFVQAAEKARILGHNEEARADLIDAFQLDPNNPMVAQHMGEITDDRTPAPPIEYPEAEKAATLTDLAPSAIQHSFHLHASMSDVIRQVLTSYGISPTIDSSVNSQTIRFDTGEVSFADASRMLELATATFLVPLDPKRALVAANSKENRDKFQRLGLETIYLPGLTEAEITDLGNVVRNVFEVQQPIISTGKATMTVRAPQATLAALNSTMAEVLEGRSELQLDVKLYNFAKTRTVNVGVNLPQQTTIFNIPSELNSVIQNNESLVQQIISSGLASPSDYLGIALALIASGQLSGSTILSQPFAHFGNGITLTGATIPSASANLQLNSTDSRALDEVSLRLLDQEEATIKSGTRYPIITSSYSSFGTSGLNIPGLSSAGVSSTLASLGISASSLTSASSQTIPQVQYQDLGLSFKAKPYIQKDKEVTLVLNLKITSLQGTELNSIPILDNQEYSAILTLRDGASAVVVSSLSRQQSRAVTGIPGLSEIPGFQSTTNADSETDFSDLAIVITPHVIRLAHAQEAGKMFVMAR
jgi:general secretion pathway protein D